MGDFDSYKFKGRVFGGFDRQDVIRYIADLSAQLEAAKKEIQQLTDQVTSAEAEKAELSAHLETLEADYADLEAENAENKRMAQQQDELLEAVKVKIAALEVDATVRAATIEKDARDVSKEIFRNISEIVTSLRIQYDTVKSDIAVTASHLQNQVGELGDELALVASVVDNAGSGIYQLESSMKQRMESAK